MILTYEIKDDILYGYFPDTLSDRDFHELPEEFDTIELKYSTLPNRLVSLCNVKSFNANFSAVLLLAEKRNKKVFSTAFKTAILVCNNYQLGFARMYQTFIENPNMRIEIFLDESEALKWLRSGDTRLTNRSNRGTG